MITVTWYALVGEITEDEMERELRERIAAKEQRGHWLFGRFQKKN
jgi:iron transport multicopper oxidase